MSTYMKLTLSFFYIHKSPLGGIKLLKLCFDYYTYIFLLYIYLYIYKFMIWSCLGIQAEIKNFFFLYLNFKTVFLAHDGMFVEKWIWFSWWNASAILRGFVKSVQFKCFCLYWFCHFMFDKEVDNGFVFRYLQKGLYIFLFFFLLLKPLLLEMGCYLVGSFSFYPSTVVHYFFYCFCKQYLVPF